MFSKQVHPQLAGYDKGDDQGGMISGTQTVAFDDGVVCPGGGDDVVAVSGEVELHTPTPVNKGMVDMSDINACGMKDDDAMPVPSSGEGDDCVFKRGVCEMHKVNGNVQVTK